MRWLDLLLLGALLVYEVRGRMLLKSLHMEIKYMTDEIKALTQAEADESAAIAETIDATNQLIAAFEAISAQLAQASDMSQITAIAADMENKVALLKANTAAITAQLAPPPAPPAPAA